jgi:hypothetical protein
MARSDQAPESRAPFFIRIDEFGSFSTDDLRVAAV